MCNLLTFLLGVHDRQNQHPIRRWTQNTIYDFHVLPLILGLATRRSHCAVLHTKTLQLPWSVVSTRHNRHHLFVQQRRTVTQCTPEGEPQWEVTFKASLAPWDVHPKQNWVAGQICEPESRFTGIMGYNFDTGKLWQWTYLFPVNVMTIDAHGHIYLCTTNHIQQFTRTGAPLRHFYVDHHDVCQILFDEHRLFVRTSTQVVAYHVQPFFVVRDQVLVTSQLLQDITMDEPNRRLLVLSYFEVSAFDIHPVHGMLSLQPWVGVNQKSAHLHLCWWQDRPRLLFHQPSLAKIYCIDCS